MNMIKLQFQPKHLMEIANVRELPRSLKTWVRRKSKTAEWVVMDSDLFRIEITDPTLKVKQIGTYDANYGPSNGKPILDIVPA